MDKDLALQIGVAAVITTSYYNWIDNLRRNCGDNRIHQPIPMVKWQKTIYSCVNSIIDDF